MIIDYWVERVFGIEYGQNSKRFWDIYRTKNDKFLDKNCIWDRICLLDSIGTKDWK